MAEALRSFTQIPECIYFNKNLGASKQMELMGCDCARIIPKGPLCDEESGCVNRSTSIECYGDTACQMRCTNRRFQDKDYADIEVFDAGAKGWGVRAKSPIKEGAFVYEYIGEVIDKARFEKRRVAYDKEGVEHFYFMMLQKDEFIDATKKGSISRFLNHSCNPNCAVSKWVVGPKLRMGIFAIKPIEPGQELTFDYNADRFGDEVQQCLCGEPNCRGVLNGKTGAIDLIPRAVWPILGLDNSVAETLREEIKTDKELKKKKELDSDIVELVPNTPISDPDQVNPIVTFLMQPQEQCLVSKILERIYITDASNVQAQLLKLHGYELFGTLLVQYKEYPAMVAEMLTILGKWPRVTKNKISSSKIEQVVRDLADSDDSKVVDLSKALLSEWSELEMAYRIPRKRAEKSAGADGTNGNANGSTPGSASTTPRGTDSATPSSPKSASNGASAASGTKTVPSVRLPRGWDYAYKDDVIYYFNRDLGVTQWEKPVDSRDTEREQRRQREREREREEQRRQERARETERQRQEKDREAADVQRIIEAARLEPNQSEAATPEPEPKRPSLTKEQKLERQFTHILAAYVPKVVFKYEDRLDHDKCKKHAKEIVRLLAEKEVRKGSTQIELTEAKKKKIKGFVSEYIKKILDHKEKRKLDTPPAKRAKRAEASA